MTTDHIRFALQAHVRQEVARILRETETPGAAIALWVNGAPVFEGSIGFRDLEQTIPLPDEARFYIYSVTKVMVAAAVLQLVEQGQVALDQPLQVYLPAFPVSQPITVRQVLRHSAGLPDYGALPTYNDALRSNPLQPWSVQEFMAHTLQNGLLYAPDEGWAYSNIGYMALVMLLERHCGCSLQTILSQQIFEPLSLGSMAVASSLDEAAVLTPGYTSYWHEDGVLEDMRARYHPGWVAHGVVISTAADLARFMQALFEGRVIGKALLGEMLQPCIVPAPHSYFRQPAYGLGLMLDAQSPDGLTAGHGGGGPGFAAAALYFADVEGRRVTSVALANRDHPDVGMAISFALKELVVTQSRA